MITANSHCALTSFLRYINKLNIMFCHLSRATKVTNFLTPENLFYMTKNKIYINYCVHNNDTDIFLRLCHPRKETCKLPRSSEINPNSHIFAHLSCCNTCISCWTVICSSSSFRHLTLIPSSTLTFPTSPTLFRLN